MFTRKVVDSCAKLNREYSGNTACFNDLQLGFFFDGAGLGAELDAEAGAPGKTSSHARLVLKNECLIAYHWREWVVGVLALLSLALTPNIAFSAWFAPHLEAINHCTTEKTLSVSSLKEQSFTSELFLTRVRNDQDSETARLLKDRGLGGVVFDRPIYPADTEIEDAQNIRLTGVVYRREPSSFERFFVSSQHELFHEMRLEKESFLLHLGSLSWRPLELCKEAAGQR